MDALDPIEHVDGVEQARLARIGQVYLSDIAGNHRLGVVAHAGQKHLHLLDGGVLRLVHDDEGVIQGATAHKGQRRNLNDILLQHLVHLVRLQQIIEGVVERAQIGVHLLLQAAGQKAQLLAGLHRRTHQDDAAHLLGIHRGHRHGDGQVGLAGAGRTHAEGHVVLLDGLDVFALVDGARLHGALDTRRALLAGVGQRT